MNACVHACLNACVQSACALFKQLWISSRKKLTTLNRHAVIVMSKRYVQKFYRWDRLKYPSQCYNVENVQTHDPALRRRKESNQKTFQNIASPHSGSIPKRRQVSNNAKSTQKAQNVRKRRQSYSNVAIEPFIHRFFICEFVKSMNCKKKTNDRKKLINFYLIFTARNVAFWLSVFNSLIGYDGRRYIGNEDAQNDSAENARINNGIHLEHGNKNSFIKLISL